MHRNNTIAGVLFLVGSIQFILIQILCEAIYPGYSTSANYISDLGVWNQPTAAAFNLSMTLLGAAILAVAYFLKKQFRLSWRAYLFAIAGLGCILIGLFPEDGYGIGGLVVFHEAGALLGFVVGGLAALGAYTFTKSPFRWISAVMGSATLLGALLFIVGEDFGYYGLGVGGIERMMTYPLLLWFTAFGGYLLGDQYAKKPQPPNA